MANYLIENELEFGNLIISLVDPVITVDFNTRNYNVETKIAEKVMAIFTMADGSVIINVPIDNVEIPVLNEATLLVKTKERVDDLYLVP